MSKTFGEMMDEAIAIKTQKEADEWFRKKCEVMQEAHPEWDIEKCASVVRSNLGYMAGYYDDKVAKHIHKFFNADHPVFGGHDYHKEVTPKKAFEMGKKLGRRSNERT